MKNSSLEELIVLVEAQLEGAPASERVEWAARVISAAAVVQVEALRESTQKEKAPPVNLLEALRG